jgi:hypothetical protein
MIKLNENKTQRRIGFFFMVIYIGIFLFYLFWDGWLYEWIQPGVGYSGTSQHFDFNIFGDMIWRITDLENGIREYDATNNLHNLVYTCYWTATIAYLALITGNKWLRQGSMATFGFPVMSMFSTINPVDAADAFNPIIFHYHSYILQIVYDINHICGTIMCIYIFYITAKQNEEIEFKYIHPTAIFTWILYLLARIFLSDWPYLANMNSIGMISTNQINNMIWNWYGTEYIIAFSFIYLINFIIKYANRRIKNPKLKTLFPFVFFAIFTVTFIAIGLIELQDYSIMIFN